MLFPDTLLVEVLEDFLWRECPTPNHLSIIFKDSPRSLVVCLPSLLAQTASHDFKRVKTANLCLFTGGRYYWYFGAR